MEPSHFHPAVSGPGKAGKTARRAFVFLAAGMAFASQADAAALRVLKQGLGSGTVTSLPVGINCGTGGTACDFTGTGTLVLTAAPAADFEGWDGDCAGAGTTATCNVDLSSDRSVRAKFRLAVPQLSNFTPEGIQTFLTANPTVNTPARFLAALPPVFRQGWIFMSRSESLQPGVAESPRILFSNQDATSVFTVGMISHASYPGAHPNAIEYMQWDAGQKNFRFHEVVVDAIPEIGNVISGDIGRFPARNRGVAVDDLKCFACHSTRNVLNRSATPGTDGMPPRTIQVKSKPNWDSYDSWGGMMPFNRDRIHQGSVEAAAFRKILNFWTWRSNPPVLSVIEQLELQPPGVSTANTISRQVGGPNDAQPIFSFDGSPPVTVEPLPVGVDGGTPASSPMSTNYNFDGKLGTGPLTNVVRGGERIQLHHPSSPGGDEGRGVQLFDLLGGLDGSLNQTRVADEINNHQFATGSVPVDVRPLALAITKNCLTQANLGTQVPEFLPFFTARNGMDFGQILDDTRFRSDSLTRRKADIEKINLDRTADIYLNPGSSEAGLIQQYGAGTSQGAVPSMERIRQEVFRRPRDLGIADATAMSASSVVTGTATQAEAYVNRELTSNFEPMALFRYFLEPLGVSVDKWSMGVRGRSRTYTFADIFGSYITTFTNEIQNHLTNVRPVPGLASPFSCPDLITAVRTSFASLPPVDGPPTYTDVQRIFNKSCIECHGGQNYPPASREGVGYLNFAENENPAAGTRLGPSFDVASAYAGLDVATSSLFMRVTQGTHDCPDDVVLGVPARMPCGGPPISGADVETLRRWIGGTRSSAAGDPHILTVDGTNYDFQSAGEFTLLRDEGMEIQVRQSPVETEGPLGPNPHTGLASCVSINTAAAIRLGSHRITYEPNLSGVPDPTGLQLRIDGILVEPKSGNPHHRFKCKPANSGRPGNIAFEEITLEDGGRILPTTAPGGLQIQHQGGTEIIITPAFWEERQVWYMNVDVNRARATEGVMGSIVPGNWLPALPNGTLPGPRPADLHQRYLGLYETFADAWRVTDSTSLFDYAPGTSTRTFTVQAWPLENPYVCRIPPEVPDPEEPAITVVRMAPPRGRGYRPPGGRPTGPVTPEEAQRLCSGLIDPATRTNCELDVQLTDERGFATTYRLAQRILVNKAPSAPKLAYPRDIQTGLRRTVSFTWNRAHDKDGGKLKYRFCHWPRSTLFTFDACTEIPQQTYGWKPGSTLSYRVTGLARGESYLWKVLAEDGQGGTSVSETRLFTVKP